MKKILFTLFSLALGASFANAAITHWQTQVGTGTTATATEFTTVSTPKTVNVGTTANTAISFEFIVNARNKASATSTLLGDYVNNSWAIAFGSSTTNTYYISDTEIGGAGYLNSGIDHTANVDTHLVFTTDGTDTLLYVNGVLVKTFTGNAIDISGTTGLGGSFIGSDAFIDPLDGNILGFAAYDSQLTATEITVHHAAFARAVPEPSTTALLGLGGLALILRRRKG